MAEWHYDLFLVANGPVDIDALTAKVTASLPVLSSPAAALLLWGAADGDRIDFWSNHSPTQLLVRFDLRAPAEHFRRLVLELAREFELRLVTGDDEELPPSAEALEASLRDSAAQQFVLHPPADDDDDLAG